MGEMLQKCHMFNNCIKTMKNILRIHAISFMLAVNSLQPSPGLGLAVRNTSGVTETMR